MVVDRSGLIALANTRAEAMFGYGPVDLIGRPPEALLTDHGRAAYANLVSAAPGVPAELAFRREGGGTFVVEATLARVGSPGELALLALRDATARKREEEALRARARQQGQVAELGRRALTGIDLGQLMGEAVTVLASDLGVEYANLLELLPDGTAVFRAGVGWRAGLVGGATVELRPGTPAGQVVLDQAPVLIEDLSTDGRYPAPSMAREHGVVSSLTVPLYGQARPICRSRSRSSCRCRSIAVATTLATAWTKWTSPSGKGRGRAAWTPSTPCLLYTSPSPRD